MACTKKDCLSAGTAYCKNDCLGPNVVDLHRRWLESLRSIIANHTYDDPIAQTAVRLLDEDMKN